MALIPPDAGIRLRMQTEANMLQPVHPVQEIPSDLPELQRGQTFTARIQEVLPDNTYRALVAGKNLTLQLPEGAKSGDALELVVIDRTAKVLIAQRTDTSTATAGPAPYTTLSRAAQLISQLLPREGEAPEPAPLNRGQPLLPGPPTSATELPAALAKAVNQSGLFYEAHQAEWIAGRQSPASLLAEPQGRVPPSSAPTIPVPGTEKAEKAMEAAAPHQAATLAKAIPEELRPLVQQQLDAVATQRLAWHGEIWPGQEMDWTIKREEIEDREANAIEEAERWSTSLRLTMPRLGQVEATLNIASGQLQVKLSSPHDDTADSLRAELPRLARAMSAAGLIVAGFDVRHEAN
jgi:hypothetical protein